MSVDATRWAWKAPVKTGTQRLVLLSLADRAGENHTCFPSAQRLVKDTLLNRKTVLNAISDMISLGLVLDTGKRVGNGVRVLQLIGVNGREGVLEATHPKIGTGVKIGTSTKNGTATHPNIGTATHPNIGIQNLSMNLSMNLSREHDWIPDQNQLIAVLNSAGQQQNLKLIFGLPDFEFQLGAFNTHFDGLVLSDSKKLYKFTNWIIDKFQRHQKQNPDYVTQAESKPEQQNQPQPVFKGVAKKFKGMSND